MRSALSLPARLSLAVMTVLVVVTIGADAMAVRELRKHLAASVADSLSWMIERAARQMDRDLLVLKEMLAAEAERLEGFPAAEVENELVGMDGTLSFAFDFGVVMVDASGGVAADSRRRSMLRGLNVSGREFFQRSFALRRPAISEPFSTAEGVPLVVLTHPLRDRSGRMYAFLAGGLDLASNRILGQSTGARSNRHGQIGVFTLDGSVVSHSEKSLILDVFENPLPDIPASANGGATMEIATADGSAAILAASHLREANWLIAGVFPTRELYHPIDRGFAAAHRWFAAGLIACCLLVLMISRRTVKDLGLLAREVETVGLHLEGSAKPRVGDRYRGEAAMLAGAINKTLDSLATANRDIDDLSTRLAEAEERERRAIAGDLHDSVCQTLALAKMRLGGIRRRCADPQFADALNAIGTLLDQSVGQLKTLIFDLSPGILYELGLVPALEWYAGEFAKRHGLPVELHVIEPLEKLDDERAIFLYRAAGELLTNAAKHASAARLELWLRGENGSVVLEVVDDGVGIPETAAPEAGFGLRSLRMRAAQFGGAFEILPMREKGTTARMSLPLQTRRDTET